MRNQGSHITIMEGHTALLNHTCLVNFNWVVGELFVNQVPCVGDPLILIKILVHAVAN